MGRWLVLCRVGRLEADHWRYALEVSLLTVEVTSYIRLAPALSLVLAFAGSSLRLFSSIVWFSALVPSHSYVRLLSALSHFCFSLRSLGLIFIQIHSQVFSRIVWFNALALFHIYYIRISDPPLALLFDSVRSRFANRLQELARLLQDDSVTEWLR